MWAIGLTFTPADPPFFFCAERGVGETELRSFLQPEIAAPRGTHFARKRDFAEHDAVVRQRRIRER